MLYIVELYAIFRQTLVLNICTTFTQYFKFVPLTYCIFLLMLLEKLMCIKKIVVYFWQECKCCCNDLLNKKIKNWNLNVFFHRIMVSYFLFFNYFFFVLERCWNCRRLNRERKWVSMSRHLPRFRIIFHASWNGSLKFRSILIYWKII